MIAPHSGLRSLFVELNDLKRMTSAGRAGSIATRLFREAWGMILADGHPSAVASEITARALAAARLGDLDRAALHEAGLTGRDITQVLSHAIDAIGQALSADLRQRLQQAIADPAPRHHAALPAFVTALEHQPRAGITCPGKPRILLEPPENHADHCLMVAVYGVLLAPIYEADPAQVFLAALAHHLHNAGMPDSGFTGEMLLGQHLDGVVSHFTTQALRQLAPHFRDQVKRARAILPDTATAEGRAFHAADAVDRVLQVNQYMRAGALTPEQVLGEMELVHAGPVKTHQDDVLRRFGLL